MSRSKIQRESRDFSLEPADSERLGNLAGPLEQHLRQIEKKMDVEIANRGNLFRISGAPNILARTERLLHDLYQACENQILNPQQIHLYLAVAIQELEAQARISNLEFDNPKSHFSSKTRDNEIKVKRGVVKARGENQTKYLDAILSNDINFGIGPAGTGKTYLAVASAVESLNEARVQRIILVRPAVEAGEKLGFLPGDLSQKVDPYLRPLYDALYEMMGFDKVARLIERNVIEIAPLAFMRGRTLNDSFVILDEAQNTTVEQMKMFLTRIGFGSVAVVTGDTTQVDLPKHIKSGLRHAIEVLNNVNGISFTFFTAFDVVRHPLVQRIVQAYEAYETQLEKNNAE